MKSKSTLFHLGVEWIGEQFRAGVFDERWRLVGKASRSAKTQRGMDEVLKRMALCALDAVDEADLQPEHIFASAILSDGEHTGHKWGPKQVNQLASHLPAQIGSRILTAPRVATVMWGMHEYELGGEPRSWLGLFAEPQPQLVAAERALPGQVKPLVVGSTAPATEGTEADKAIAPSESILSAVNLAEPEVLLLVGEDYEDEKSAGVKHIVELLASAGLNIPLHISKHGTHVGTWAAAKLAARTFASRGEVI